MVSLGVVQTVIFAALSAVQASTCLLRYPLALLEDSLELSLLISPGDYRFLKNSMRLSTAFSQLYFAGHADIRPPRKLVAVCLAGSGIAMVFFGNTDNYDVLVMMAVISGAFQGPVWPAICKSSFTWTQDSRLNSFLGLLALAEYLGRILAENAASFLVRKYSSWRFVYPPLAAAVLLVSGVAFLALYAPGELKIDVPGRGGSGKSPRASWRGVLSLPGVGDLSAAVFCLRLVRCAVLFWLPEFLVRKAGYTDRSSDVALAVYKAGNVLGCVGIGLTARRDTVLTQSLVLIGVGTLGLGLFWITTSWGFAWSVNFLALSGFAIGGPAGALGASFPVSLGELDGRRAGGAVVGVVNAFGGLGEILEQTVVGFVVETYGWNSMFILMINLLCFSAFLVNRTRASTRPLIMGGRQYLVSNSAAI